MDVRRMDREKWRQEINANCPHRVDLTPPGDGYGEAVRAQIMDFLESRIGSFDMYVELADGEPFIRYCFEREADAEAFHALFASVAEKAIYKKAG
jgi:hypothetical protein